MQFHILPSATNLASSTAECMKSQWTAHLPKIKHFSRKCILVHVIYQHLWPWECDLKSCDTLRGGAYPRSQTLRVRHWQCEVRTEFRTASDERARPGNEARGAWVRGKQLAPPTFCVLNQRDHKKIEEHIEESREYCVLWSPTSRGGSFSRVVLPARRSRKVYLSEGSSC